MNGIKSQYFSGKRVLITGGSSGIGKALAHKLLTLGARVAILSDLQRSLDTACREFTSAGFSVPALQCDLADTSAILHARDQLLNSSTLDGFGTPDILVNNAGFGVYRTFEESPAEEIERLLEVNLLGAMRLTKELLPAFIERRSGSIVNVSSIAGRLPITPNATYAAAKHGMVGWSHCLRYELSHFNVKVNLICPGRVETRFFEHETFRRSQNRPGTGWTVSMDQVVAGILTAIEKNRAVTYVPSTLGIFSWAREVAPFVAGRMFDRLMFRRIDAYYRSNS